NDSGSGLWWAGTRRSLFRRTATERRGASTEPFARAGARLEPDEPGERSLVVVVADRRRRDQRRADGAQRKIDRLVFAKPMAVPQRRNVGSCLQPIRRAPGKRIVRNLGLDDVRSGRVRERRRHRLPAAKLEARV